MRYLFAILFSCLLGVCSAQQELSLRLLQQLPVGAVADVQSDVMGNFYQVGKEGRLKKLSPLGDSLAVFNQVRNGPLFSMDLSNPLRPLLFYKNNAQVVVLDRNLAPQVALNLRTMGMQPMVAATSFDNNIWMFDALSGTIKKLDERGAVLLETPDLRIAIGVALQPVRIIDQDKWLYLYDPGQGLYQFDYFGNFKRKMPVTGWTDVLVASNQVYGVKEGALQRYSLATLLQDQQSLPEALKGSTIRLAPAKLLSWKNGMLSVYGVAF